MGFFCRNFDLAFLEFVCLRSVAKLAIWKFLNNELAHYFRFFNHLKEMKACFQSSLLKKAEKIAFESQIIKKNLMAVLGFRTFHVITSFFLKDFFKLETVTMTVTFH